MAKKEYRLLEHLAKTHSKPGDRLLARREADRIAALLREKYGARVFGIGSAFDETRRFGARSDIDLVVESLPAGSYFKILAEVEDLTSFDLDLIPLESAHENIRRLVETTGVPL